MRGNSISVIVKKSPVRLIIKDQHGRVLVEEKQLGMYWHGREEVACYKEMKQGERFYGFGEKTSFLDKRGEKMTMWNTDVYAPHNPQIDALYQSVPFYVGLSDEGAFGLFFDNTHKTTFDLKSSQDTLSFSAEAGLLDYYVFCRTDNERRVATIYL
ncbi:MAG: alpha-glucosidase, partial [Bacillaceae bacterium]|nr:alpha-glucosidase [Bacillaceae bacterium]